MLNKLLGFLRSQDMIAPGDSVICAVSGGADSTALLFAMYLLRDTLEIQLSAAHFNHHLRGEESDRDEAFVRRLCAQWDIPLHLGGGEIRPGKKGLEAAARDARYAFLRGLPGKIATAHTADDNAETVLLHLVRGTGLKGLGGIAPVSGNVIRPMLTVTRQEVEAFLETWHLPHVEDSSNESEAFLRNRLRHAVLPLLREENPKIAENVSAMALRLRQDEAYIRSGLAHRPVTDVAALKALPPALRSRELERFLRENGVKEPEGDHIARLESLLYSEKPSAMAQFPGGVTVDRRYDTLAVREAQAALIPTPLPCPGCALLPGMRVVCGAGEDVVNTAEIFTVQPQGQMVLRPRQPGDAMRLSGGTKSLKKLFIDRKIPAALRCGIPVLADDGGVLGVWGIGVNLDRAAKTLPAVQIRFQPTDIEKQGGA